MPSLRAPLWSSAVEFLLTRATWSMTGDRGRKPGESAKAWRLSADGVLQLVIPLDCLIERFQAQLTHHPADGQLGIVGPEQAAVFRLRVVVADFVTIFLA